MKAPGSDAHGSRSFRPSSDEPRDRRHGRRCRGRGASAGDAREEIIRRADGVPLFAEEMTKAVLEAQGDGDEAKAAASRHRHGPAKLAGLFVGSARPAGSAKEVAQIAAAIGRSPLRPAGLRRGETESELEAALERLVQAGLLFREGTPPEATYRFKHALLQDLAYGALLRERKRALHARIAEALEATFREVGETQPELLARHCAEAGCTEKAAALWGKAGRASLKRSALVEAESHFSRALAMTAAQPSTPALRREEIACQFGLRAPCCSAEATLRPKPRLRSQAPCADRAGGRARRAGGGSARIVHHSPRPLGRQHRRFVRRRNPSACRAVPGARGEGGSQRRVDRGASGRRADPVVFRRLPGEPGPFRPGDRALPSDGGSTSDPIRRRPLELRPGRPGGGALGARLPGSSAGGRGRGASVRPRFWPCADPGQQPDLCHLDPPWLRPLRNRKGACDRDQRAGGRERGALLQSVRSDDARPGLDLRGRPRECGPADNLCACRLSFERSDVADGERLVKSGESARKLGAPG